MKLILIKDAVSLGHEGDIIEASEGYARNYLLPRKIAVMADAGAMNQLAKNKKRLDLKREAFKKEMTALAEKLGAVTLEIKADAGESGKLFGSVTAQDIAASLHEKEAVMLDRKKFIIEEPIRSAGEHTVRIKLAPGIEAELKVNVVSGS